ncbi:antiactivator of flagellar biosynthesis FleN protein [Janthinobacterium sp. 17J80-10]|uniref:MinD/ParA family ATP-binding protein n=1 Tax=Janthinobacterium sp. 17J80-10 TaxID=2497863 RepID=UPI00100582A3|nr:antiactivator of flagellar biosynthesis FleN protein [Janthinobacterium sp. 17J80-10]QAU34331.1 antiactivator of flagellar biosynthesis FleN protein [Janthinobacterium sp. 17J80-10]
MANFHNDQAEGLRRMLAGPRPRVFTFLSALPDEEKNAMLTNLGASLVRSGSDVLMLDARAAAGGIAAQLDAPRRASLLDVARQEGRMSELVQSMPQGFGVARLAHATVQARSQLEAAVQDDLLMRRLGQAFGTLAREHDIVVVDGELGVDDGFALPALAGGEIVVQVSNSAASIKAAYSMIKRLTSALGRRPISVVVSGVDERQAGVVHDNIAQVASRYLATRVELLGSVPADEHVGRAARLGRSVVEAFPLAGASLAFRKLAGRCSMADLAPAAGMRMAG